MTIADSNRAVAATPSTDAVQPGHSSVTVLFTDIEGSTRLWEHDRERMSLALARHDALARSAVESHRGIVFKMTGDGMGAAFGAAGDAIQAVLHLQQVMSNADSTHGIPLRIRCGLHAGAVERRDNDLFGPPVNRTARIMSAAHGGQVLLSKSVVDAASDSLPAAASLRDLGNVRLRDLATPEHVYQLLHPDLRDVFPALRSLEATPNNLPQQVTSFIGRERDIAEITHLLKESRLLTLTGLGGIGKTRVALQVAANQSEQFADGVWFVELAQMSDPLLVPQALASVVGVKGEAGRSVVEALERYVADRQVLLLLDNCEHLAQACAELVHRLLRTGPNVKVMATSREPLRVTGEAMYQVTTLTVPALTARPTLEALAQSEAIQLFCERAILAKRGFKMTRQNSGAIHEICHRLAGIPLAIELAAARVRALSVETIDARLSDRFRLLTDGNRAALPRQQTLRASIDWSYDLLSSAEQSMLQRVAVFAGGFTLDAAESVCGGDGIDEADVLDVLCRLVERSLVILDADGCRYDLLETVRHYAREKAQQSGELAVATGRHLAFFAELTLRARTELYGREQASWLSRLDQDLENLLAAHAAADHIADGSELGFQLIDRLKNYWTMRGLLVLGHRVTVEMLAREGIQARTKNRCCGLFDAGWLCHLMGRHSEAQHYLEESVAIARELELPKFIAAPLQPLGLACLAQGNTIAARKYLDEALELAEHFGSKRDITAALNQLALLDRAEGLLDRAETLFQRALDNSNSMGDSESSAICRLNLSMVAIDRKMPARARELLLDVFAIVDRNGSKPLAQCLLDVCAGLAALREQWAAAAGFYGAAEAVALETGQKREFSDEAFLRPLIDRTRDALGSASFTEAEEFGAGQAFHHQMLEVNVWLAADA